MNKPMTAKEFVESSDRCPKCHSENVDWTEISVEGDSTYQDGSCQDCDARFYTVSRLVGYGLYEHDTADAEVRTVEEPEQPSKEWLYVFTELLGIVEAEYGDDPEPEDLPRWKEIIDHANRLLGIEDEEEKGRDDGDTEQAGSGT